jgi:acetyltransferase
LKALNMTARNLHLLLRPRSIAVIGASSRLQTVGGMVMRNLIKGGFPGSVMAVNPDATAVTGMAVYRDVSHLPETPDLALVCTAPDTLPGIVDDLGTRGTSAAAILASTEHSPADSSSRSLQQAVLKAAKPHLLRVLGPNSIGLLVPELALNASFAPVSAQSGQIAFISQSGALTSAALDWAAARDIGLSYVVSLGDAADIDAADMIEYLCESKCRTATGGNVCAMTAAGPVPERTNAPALVDCGPAHVLPRGAQARGVDRAPAIRLSRRV